MSAAIEGTDLLAMLTREHRAIERRADALTAGEAEAPLRRDLAQRLVLHAGTEAAVLAKAGMQALDALPLAHVLAERLQAGFDEAQWAAWRDDLRALHRREEDELLTRVQQQLDASRRESLGRWLAVLRVQRRAAAALHPPHGKAV